MKKLEVVKTVAGGLASLSVGVVVTQLVKAITPPGTWIVIRVVVWVGGFVLSGLAGIAAAKQMEGDIDNIVDDVKHIKELVKAEDI